MGRGFDSGFVLHVRLHGGKIDDSDGFSFFHQFHEFQSLSGVPMKECFHLKPFRAYKSVLCIDELIVSIHLNVPVLHDELSVHQPPGGVHQMDVVIIQCEEGIFRSDAAATVLHDPDERGGGDFVFHRLIKGGESSVEVHHEFCLMMDGVEDQSFTFLHRRCKRLINHHMDAFFQEKFRQGKMTVCRSIDDDSIHIFRKSCKAFIGFDPVFFFKSVPSFFCSGKSSH